MTGVGWRGHQGRSPWAGEGLLFTVSTAGQAQAQGLDPGTTFRGNLGATRLSGGPLGATLKGTKQSCWPHITLFFFLR